jgi:hypothetical protein
MLDLGQHTLLGNGVGLCWALVNALHSLGNVVGLCWALGNTLH